MNLEMQHYLGRPASLENTEGYKPPAFEIGRALEHYRKSKRRPFPDLMQTKFYYMCGETNNKDEWDDTIEEEWTHVWLCDLDGDELAHYLFKGMTGRMTVVK